MIDKKTLKIELQRRYNVSLADDDPLWLLMLMQKDMTSEVLNATKTAIKNNKNIGNINLKAIIASAVTAFILGVSSVGGYTYYVYTHSTLDLFLRKNHINYNYGYAPKSQTPTIIFLNANHIKNEKFQNKLFVFFK